MNTLVVLPGNSLKNKEWGEAIASHYGKNFDKVYLQNYDHWETGEELIDFEMELEKLREEMAEVQAGETITIFAKSAGTILAILAVDRGIVSPACCIFFGIPFDWAFRDVFTSETPLKDFHSLTIAFHNHKDPTADFNFTKEVIEEKSNGNIELVTIDGANHDYFDFVIYDECLVFEY